MRQWPFTAVIAVMLLALLATTAVVVPQAFALASIDVPEFPPVEQQVPEPSTLVLVGVGLGLVGFVMRRRLRPRLVKID